MARKLDLTDFYGLQPGREEKIRAAFAILEDLLDDERRLLFSEYCVCGSIDIFCQCWNDE
jgi:hypothetical protein